MTRKAFPLQPFESQFRDQSEKYFFLTSSSWQSGIPSRCNVVFLLAWVITSIALSTGLCWDFYLVQQAISLTRGKAGQDRLF